MWFHIFALFWGMAYLVALCEFIIGGSCCVWYFSKKKGEESVIRRSLWWGIIHTGSLALGSFLLALVWLIQSILDYARVIHLILSHKILGLTKNRCESSNTDIGKSVKMHGMLYYVL